MKLAHVLLLVVTAAVTVASKSPDVEEQLKESQDRAADGLQKEALQELQDTITEYLGTIEEPWLPYLPLISFDTLSLALTEVSIFGLSDVVKRPHFGSNAFGLALTFPALTFYSDHYIIGGKLIDLPIIGESTANITLQDFKVDFSVGVESRTCAVENSTTYSLTAENAYVNFANLNPEHDEQGVLINIMIESVMDDILKWLSIELSPGGGLHAQVDQFIVDAINNQTCKGRPEESYAEDSYQELYLPSNNAIGALQALADHLGSVFHGAFSSDAFWGLLHDSVRTRAKEVVEREGVDWVF